MNERRVTLADIAREAKVHVTTVSLALRPLGETATADLNANTKHNENTVLSVIRYGVARAGGAAQSRGE